MNKTLTFSMLAAIIFGGILIALPAEADSCHHNGERRSNNYWKAEAEHWKAPDGYHYDSTGELVANNCK